jgi:hypothetical protein
VQVRRDDGVAIHISPKPCVAVRKGGSEASVGEHTGQPLSLVKIHISGADAVAKVEGNTERECPDGPAWSEKLACVEARCPGTGRARVSPVAARCAGWHREGEEQ